MEYLTQIETLRRIPYIFKYYYQNGDLAIDQAHNFICNIFDHYRQPRVESGIQLANTIANAVPTSESEMAVKQQSLTLLQQITYVIWTYLDKGQYIERVSQLIQEYQRISAEIGSTGARPDLLQARANIIGYYLAILNDYIPVVEEKMANVDGSGVIKNSGGRKRKGKEVDLTAWRHAIQRYQGKQENKIPADLYNQLEGYFESAGIFTYAHAQTLEFDKKGRRIGTSRELMIHALDYTGNSKFYEDVRLICAVYWGWQLPDISSLEEMLVENFKKTQKVFSKIKTDVRSSNLNIDVLLWKHLQALNHDCDKEDFRTIKSTDISRTYETLLETMFSQAGVTYIPGV